MSAPAAITAPERPAGLAGLDDAAPEIVLAAIERTFGAQAALACSFGVEDIALIELCRRHAPSIAFFTLDTGRLPEATYELIDLVRARGVVVESFFPAALRVEALTSAAGFFSFKSSVEARQECCRIRKVEPLQRALAGRAAWVTGLRRAQSVTRAAVDVVGWDAGHALWKFNPLAAWTTAQTWDFVRANDLPVNRLHDEGYPSIGCAPCTRPIAIGEDERAGRWWWELPEHKECGLHPRSADRSSSS
ncbi:MAG: phosphoadenylyl-sulfate reductase [Deltaproteobacteria bacterium]|nr:phosphoadenylyl-sulfate reductase [Deltaproteobacteria bacterium]